MFLKIVHKIDAIDRIDHHRIKRQNGIHFIPKYKKWAGSDQKNRGPKIQKVLKEASLEFHSHRQI